MQIDILTVCGQTFLPAEYSLEDSQISDEIKLAFYDCYGYFPSIDYPIKPEIHLNNEDTLFLLLSSAECNKRKLNKLNIRPRLIAGYSVGFLVGLLYAEVVNVQNLARFIFMRGKLMSDLGKKIDGGMVSITGMECSKIKNYIDKFFLNKIFISNINGSKNISLSGFNDDLTKLKKILEDSYDEGDYRFTKISAQGPWHSVMLNPIADDIFELADKYIATSGASPRYPLISSHSGRTLKTLNDIVADIVPNMIRGVNWPTVMQSAFNEIGSKELLAYELTDFSFIRRINRFAYPNIRFLE